ncbi:SNF7 family protein [Oesophagostomum dentatum]|uniref:SNF7 family protein n=1 Tax=Oesophagostomum dentatum TaxID=61180 RepID=A0A0B1TCU3_OESDE|nr:SNF7 family protein [Oesophagostomum dentatum]
MDFLFGRRKTPAEMLRQNQRALNKAIRELDREKSRMEMQEKKVIAEIKKMAKMNQMAMKGVTRAMQSMNRQLNLPQIQKIMMEFEKQSEIMDMKEEIMGDAIDDALGDETDDAESEQIVNQVLDELGIQMGQEMAGLPTTGGQIGVPAAAEKARQPVAAGGGGTDIDDDLQARLDQLRRE